MTGLPNGVSPWQRTIEAAASAGCLMAAMLAQAHPDGVDRVSLSVETDNPALSLYDRLGFVPTRTVGDAVTIVRNGLQRSG